MRRNMKRLLSLVLSLVMVIGLLPTAVAAVGSEHEAHSYNVIHVDAVAGNCTTPGNIEFWYCGHYNCRKYYADEAMTQEISPADAVLTPGVHSADCVGCGYQNVEKTFTHFVPAEQPEYDEEFYFWSNGGFYKTFSERLEGSTFIFVGEGSDGKLYAMGNETNPDGSRQAVCLDGYLNGDGSVTVDSDAVEFFSFKNLAQTYTFSPDNGYMVAEDGKIIVRGQYLEDMSDDLRFSQTIRFEQDKELANYTEEKGYLFSWDLDCGLIMFDTTGPEPKFATTVSWTQEAGDTRVHNLMLYEASCAHPHLEHTEAKAATCTEAGNVEYWYCSNCKKYYSDAEGTAKLSQTIIYATDHNWGDWEVVTEATASSDGLKQRVCKNDSNHVEEEELHYTVRVPAIPATCTETGRVEYWSCDSCGTNYADAYESNELYHEQMTVRATGHQFNAEGVCVNCSMQRNVYKQISTLEEFDQLSENAYYIIVFKDGDKTYSVQLPGENPYWADWNYDYDFDLFVVDENENGVPDCIETADLDSNGIMDYLEDQDFDDEIGTYDDYFRVYENLAYAFDEAHANDPNFTQVTAADDGSITVRNEGAMEFQMMKSGVWGGATYWEDDLESDYEHNGITEKDRVRAAWVPNFWVASYGTVGSFCEDNLLVQNRIYGDEEHPGVLDNKNWKISFREDGTACLVSSWTELDDTAALQFAKYVNENGEADMTVVGLPEWMWEDSPIMSNRTALLPAYLYASEPVYDKPAHTCSFGLWEDDTATSRKRECSVCGAVQYLTVDEDKPVNVTPTTNAANTNLSNTDLELIDKIFTEEEQTQIAEGAEVKVYLKVEDISDNVPAEDRTAIAAKAGEDEVGMYLDIDLFKQIGAADENQITQTAGAVTITITIPEELINKDASVTRTYKIIRVHTDENGNVTPDVIEGIFNPEDNTFTFETDKFSTYALAYADEREEEPLPEANIQVARMILGNELAMQFAFPKDKIVEGVDYVVSVTKTYADGREDKNILVPQSEWKTSGSYYYVSFNGIAAKEMGDEIHAQILTKDGMPVGDVYTDSVQAYAVRQLRKATEAEIRTLYVDMLNYGAAAQTYFKYDAANLVTKGLTETEKGYGTKEVKLENNLVKGDGYAASQLNLASSIQLRVKFNGIDSSMYAIVKFTNHMGREIEARVEGSEFMYSGTVVVINQVVAADYNQDVTITVYDSSGNVVASALESVASYIARMSGGAEIYSAVAKYCAAAYGYLHRND